MSTLFAPAWRTRRDSVDFGHAPESNPESPNRPHDTPYSGSSGSFPESEGNLTPPVVCYVCRGTDFWAGTGKVTCRRCHPPAPGAERGGAA